MPPGGEGGGGGSLVPTLSTRCATGGRGRGGGGRGGGGGGEGEGGGGGGEGVLRGQIQILSKILAGYISLIECVIAFKFSQCVGHTKDYLYAES